MPTTLSPRATRRCTTCMPMNPAAPVTRTFMAAHARSEAPDTQAARFEIGLRERGLHVDEAAAGDQPRRDLVQPERPVFAMRDGSDDRVGAGQFVPRGQLDAVFVPSF